MKKIFKREIITTAFLFVLSNITSVWSFAQDSAASSSSSTTTHTTTTQSATAVQPWMWIVGGIVLLVIIIALVSGRNKNNASTDKVTYTRKVERE